MTPDWKIDVPDTADTGAIARHAAAALTRYDIRRPSFNLAANSDRVTPGNKAFFIYPEEAHALITASLLVLKELDEESSVSRSTRERFVIENTKDQLRGLQGSQSPAEYQALYDRTMGSVTSKLTGMESLAFSGSYETKAEKLKR